MIVGAAVLPSAPVLVPGVSATLPAGVERVCEAIDAVVEGLPYWDTAVLVAAAPRSRHSAQELHAVTEASLNGVGRPDITHPVRTDHDVTERLARLSQYAVRRAGRLPLGLATLALLLGDAGHTVAISVPPSASFEALTAVGTGVAEAVGEGEAPARRAVVVAAGDLSAGLGEDSPLTALPDAQEWDDRVVEVVDGGRLDGLADVGPEQAARVGAQGWAPMAVLHGATARAKLGVARRHYSAPCGIGYLVAGGA